jgi:hypothetical protein
MRLARSAAMTTKIEPWTIPLHVVLWTTWVIGFVMLMVVVLMH